MTTRDLVFGCVGLITALSAILAVTTRHIVHAALWLVVALGTLAGCYVILGAELVGLVQLLVYVGAVVVLVLFALMLTNAPIGASREIDTPRWLRAVGAVLAAASTGLLAAVLIPLVPHTAVAVGEGPAGSSPAIGAAIFGTWVWPFELLSVLLLVALIGAFAVSRLVLSPTKVEIANQTADSAQTVGEAVSSTNGSMPDAGAACHD